jgi:small-conductance mechanosensitive channel
MNMETVQEFFVQLRAWLEIPLLPVGNTRLTLWMILYLLIFIALLVYLTGKLKTWIVNRLLARTHIDIGVRQAVGSIFHYVVIAIGFMIILQTAGIDLSALTVLAGALGIGIGFGLQNITNNFVSGLIILFERPIKVGDRIEVGDVSGDVVKISPRATTVITNDNIAIIIPNSEFTSSQVINWSYMNREVRFNFPVGVSYGSDPALVRKTLLEVAADHPGVLKDRNADVLLEEFGDSSLNFILRVWTRDYATTPGVLRSELNYAICRKFKEHGIEIPFPQRDLHIRSGVVEVKTTPGGDLS